MTAPLATAGWPLDKLVSALARAGWDDLTARAAAGLRTVLRALSDVLPHGSATGQTTAQQLADAAGLSERWVRRCLTLLEDMELITWTRGQIRDGRPIPSTIRVSKRGLADLVNRARRSITGRVEERAATTARRIRETLRSRNVRAPRRKTRDRAKHVVNTAEVSASPLPLTRRGTGHEVAPVSRTMLGKPRPQVGGAAARLRQAIAKANA